MDDKRKYFRQTDKLKYPDPRLSADTGWEILKNTLDKELPVTKQIRWKRYAFLFLISFIVLSVLIVSVPVFRKVFPPQENTPSILNESVLKNESQPEIKQEKPNSRMSNDDSISVSRPLAHSQSATSDGIKRKSIVTHKKNSFASTLLTRGRSEFPGNADNDAVQYDVHTQHINETDSPNTNIVKSFQDVSMSVPYGQFEKSEAGLIEELKMLRGRDTLITDEAFGKNSPRINPVQLTIRSKSVNKPVYRAGLSWEAYGYSNNLKKSFKYFKYNEGVLKSLIPGIWISRKISSKNEILLTVDPVSDYITNNNHFYTSQGSIDSLINQPDSSATVNKMFLHKIRNSKITVQSNWHLNNNWMLGAGVEYSKFHRALIETRPPSTMLHDSITFTAFPHGSTTFLRSGLWSAKAEIAYKFRSLSVGTSIHIPLHSLGKHTNIKPVNGQFFIRWEIVSSKEKY